MNLSYNHCYKIQLILLSCIVALIPSNRAAKNHPRNQAEMEDDFFVLSQTRARRAVYTEGEDGGGEGVGVGGCCYFILK